MARPSIERVAIDVLPGNLSSQYRLKTFPPSSLSSDVWKEIEFIFWRHKLDCLSDSAYDGLDPLEIESTKRGVEIYGGVWFLGGKDASNPRYEIILCLSRPRFSSLESVTVEKLRSASISSSEFEDGLLTVMVA